MKLILSIVIIFSYLTSHSQIFGAVGVYTGGFWEQKDLEKFVEREIEKGVKNKMVTNSQKKVDRDTLIYFIKKTNDAFTVKFTFNNIDTTLNQRYCDYQEYTFDCSPCSQIHLKNIIYGSNFRPINDSTFLSSYLDKSKMLVSYKNNSKDCMTLKLRTVDLPKNEYKELYKNLKKK
jgi:hypothetical protein